MVEAAKAGFEAYAKLASPASVQMNPKDDAWQMEAAYAANNLGMLALRQAGDLPKAAEAQFRAKRCGFANVSVRTCASRAIRKL